MGMPEEPVERVQAWFAAWNGRDFDALRAMYSPAAAYLRADGFSQGADAIVSYLKAVAAELPWETATVDAVLVAQDAVAVEWTARTGGEGPAQRARMAEFFRFQDGRILSQHQFGDPARTVRLLAAQCGQAAPPSAAGSPGETMVGGPSPVLAMPAAPPAAAAPAAEPEVDWSAAGGATDLQLRFEAGPDQGLVFTITSEALTLGRALDNDVRVTDPCTSSHHARLDSQAGRLVIVDLGSTNGTYVNGMQVQSSELHPGDRITLGGNTVTFTGPAHAAPAGASLQPISA